MNKRLKRTERGGDTGRQRERKREKTQGNVL